MNLLITICARGGSKGIPGKNLRPVNGKPLIAYSIEAAQNFAAKYPADISLSSDSDEIKDAAKQYGLITTYIRPATLATDTAGKKDTITDLVKFEETQRSKSYDFILDLDVTSPLRSLHDLVAAFQVLQNDTNALNIFSVNPANRNPYFNMVEQKENGYYGLVKKGDFVTRQSAPAGIRPECLFLFLSTGIF